jgi:biotin carboxyl carrier protein
VPDDRDQSRDLPRDASGDLRDDAARASDHAGIDRLATTLIPALMAKLGTLNVGELEVREGEWRVRLRRPAGAGPVVGRRSSDRPSRAHPGHEQHGHAPATPEPHRTARAAFAAAGASTNGSGGSGLAPVGPGRVPDNAPDGDPPADGAEIATSPAVGVFQPGPKSVTGTRVRAGDRLGVVDMLGVPQEVVAPLDGIIVGVIVDAGTAVEYGQELVRLEPAARVEGR